jgi:hypothetical protein
VVRLSKTFRISWEEKDGKKWDSEAIQQVLEVVLRDYAFQVEEVSGLVFASDDEEIPNLAELIKDTQSEEDHGQGNEDVSD